MTSGDEIELERAQKGGNTSWGERVVMYPWRVRLGEEGVRADAALLTTFVLQGYGRVELGSIAVKLKTNSSQQLGCCSHCG